MEFEFCYLKHSDLVFHILAHMRVNNASDLFSQDYIDMIQQGKSKNDTDMWKEVTLLAPYYNENFERLGIINFLPFYCSDFNSLKNALQNYDTFNQKDLEIFIYPFIDLLERECEFYFDYWDKKYTLLQDERVVAENYIKKALLNYRCVFDYHKKNSAVVCFSFSLTRNGRGLTNENKFSAIIPFPEDETYYQNSFFTVLHEYTHQFTDVLLNTSINMEDGSHDLSENVVILFDYYLISAINKFDIQSYFAWIARNSDNEGVKINDSEFLSIFKVLESLNNTLVSLVDDIICYK